MTNPEIDRNPELLDAAHIASPHLSEDALDGLLSGLESPAAPCTLAHLATCDACAQRLQEFEAHMALFNQATLSWSEARSNRLCPGVARDMVQDMKARTPARRLTTALGWASAAAVTAALVVGSGSANRSQTHVPQGSNRAAMGVPVEAFEHTHPVEQLASDNAMLAVIDSEVSNPQPEQLGVFQLDRGQAAQARRTRQVRD